MEKKSSFLVPTIDVSALYTEKRDEAFKEIGKKVVEACSGSGFFKLIGHPVSKERLDGIMKDAYRFFKLPTEEKMKFAPHKWNKNNSNSYRGYFPASVNGKEGLDMGSYKHTEDHETIKNKTPFHEVSVWPEEKLVPGWKQAVCEYYDIMIELGRDILRAIAIGLGIEDKEFFAKAVTSEGMSTFRFNYYPLLADKKDFKPVALGNKGEPLSCEIHTDGAVLTILYQPEVGGLQVETARDTDDWEEVEPTPYAFVVNTGLCLSQWTNNVLNASNHRVRLLTEPRVSIPFFIEPEYSSVIECAPNCSSETRPPQFPKTTYGEFLTESLKRFVEYQRTPEEKSQK